LVMHLEGLSLRELEQPSVTIMMRQLPQ